MKWDRDTNKVTVWKTKLHHDDRRRMRIVIPSMGRADSVRTLAIQEWPRVWAPFTYLAVPEAEAGAYKERWPGVKQIVIAPEMATGIAQTRQYLWDQAVDVDFVCQVSDDLRFAYRTKDKKLHGTTEVHLQDIFDILYRLMAHGWIHAGLSARGGNNHVDLPIKAIGRMCDVYVHNHRACKALGVRWDRKLLMSDFDVTLQLLRLGHPNAIIYSHCWDQGASNAPGGCSTYRDPEVLAEEARILAQLHPGYVTVVDRSAKNWRGFDGTRTDVRIQWRKAFDSWGLGPGQKPRGHDVEFTHPDKLPRKKKAVKRRATPTPDMLFMDGAQRVEAALAGKKKVIKRKVAKKRVIRRKAQ